MSAKCGGKARFGARVALLAVAMLFAQLPMTAVGDPGSITFNRTLVSADTDLAEPVVALVADSEPWLSGNDPMGAHAHVFRGTGSSFDHVEPPTGPGGAEANQDGLVHRGSDGLIYWSAFGLGNLGGGNGADLLASSRLPSGNWVEPASVILDYDRPWFFSTSDGTFLLATRRGQPQGTPNAVDVYRTPDHGQTWELHATTGEDLGVFAGAPSVTPGDLVVVPLLRSGLLGTVETWVARSLDPSAANWIVENLPGTATLRRSRGCLGRPRTRRATCTFCGAGTGS